MDYATRYIGKKVKVTIDRPIGSKHPKYGDIYPVNYGYIKGVIAPDGKDLDAYVLGVEEPVKEFEGKCIAVIHRSDDEDDKLIVVPKGKEYSDDQIMALVEFQEKWFKSEVVRE
ncbi:MAG: inorganic diphosphatase [Nanoarchaeota archaeon]|nr:inorganic diphosphatase [Nanoarchaeota archaeon]